MGTETNHRDPQEQADIEQAWRHFEEGTPFEPDLAKRIRARAEKARHELLQKGILDDEAVNRLLRDDET